MPPAAPAEAPGDTQQVGGERGAYDGAAGEREDEPEPGHGRDRNGVRWYGTLRERAPETYPSGMRDQIISVVGACLVLAAYAALQAGLLRSTSRNFCLMNAIGSGLLTWVAVVDRRIGFIILEGAWALLSLAPLLRRPRTDTP